MSGVSKRCAALIVAVMITVATLLAATPGAAVAAPKFNACGGLTAKFEHGVAKTSKAAARQETAGFYRPRINKAVFKANRGLDRDRDGTACEKRAPAPAAPVAPVDPWMTLDAASMLPLKVMDFTTGTSLDVSSFEAFFDTDDTYVEELPALSDGTPVSGFRGQYYTRPGLTPGKAYEFTLTVNTPAHWSCSIYNQSACTFLAPTRDVMVWSFTYAAEPGVIKDATKVSWRRLYL